MDSFEIVSLNESLTPKVSALIHGYLNSESNGEQQNAFNMEQRVHYEQILNRFIEFDLAKCYLAKYDEEYIGFVVLSGSFSITKGYPVLRVDGLYTSPQYRKMGAARKLMKHAVDLARGGSACRLQLETDDVNTAARDCTLALDLSRYRVRECTCCFCERESSHEGQNKRKQRELAKYL